MRVNRDRPVTRQRFSIGHEVGHTLLPGYETQVQCRKPRLRDWHDRSDIIEYLCDVASSEFLFPFARFQSDFKETGLMAEGMLSLASRYRASPEATVRRVIDLATEPTAAIFFRWKNKPSEKSRKSMADQKSLPGIVSRDPARKLRVEYSVCNEGFDSLGHHIPAHKSVDENSVIYRAATGGVCLDANREHLDLGAFKGLFCINVMPIFTQGSDLGPGGETSVIAILQVATKPRAR